MPAQTYQNHLYRYGFTKEALPDFPLISGKEEISINIAIQNEKTTILCSFLSTVHSIAEQLMEKGIDVFIVEGKTRNKNEIIMNFKNHDKKAVLILSPVGERDLDIPQTDILIVYDLVNSPKTVYQKMKRSRGGKVIILFYEGTAERNKVKRVVNDIIVKYPWSTILHSEKHKLIQ